MKQNDTNTFWTSLFILLLVVGCGGTSNQKSYETAPVVRESAQATQQTRSFYINDQNNAQLANITIEEDEFYVQFTAKELFGVKTRADKRKYYDGSDVMHYAVKYSEDGFKLRDQDEKLLWKIKFGETGLKVSNNEEMTDAYKISTSSEGKIKLKQNDEEIATLRFKEGNQVVNIPDKYVLNGFGGSLAMGVLLIAEIPDEQKVLLCAEVVGAGQ